MLVAVCMACWSTMLHRLCVTGCNHGVRRHQAVSLAERSNCSELCAQVAELLELTNHLRVRCLTTHAFVAHAAAAARVQPACRTRRT